MAESVIKQNAVWRNITIQAQTLQDIEDSFLAASNLSVFSGTSSRGSGMAWYGYKVVNTTEARAIVFRPTSNGDMYFGIATRDEDGNWSLRAIE